MVPRLVLIIAQLLAKVFSYCHRILGKEGFWEGFAGYRQYLRLLGERDPLFWQMEMVRSVGKKTLFSVIYSFLVEGMKQLIHL